MQRSGGREWTVDDREDEAIERQDRDGRSQTSGSERAEASQTGAAPQPDTAPVDGSPKQGSPYWELVADSVCGPLDGDARRRIGAAVSASTEQRRIVDGRRWAVDLPLYVAALVVLLLVVLTVQWQLDLRLVGAGRTWRTTVAAGLMVMSVSYIGGLVLAVRARLTTGATPVPREAPTQLKHHRTLSQVVIVRRTLGGTGLVSLSIAAVVATGLYVVVTPGALALIPVRYGVALLACAVVLVLAAFLSRAIVALRSDLRMDPRMAVVVKLADLVEDVIPDESGQQSWRTDPVARKQLSESLEDCATAVVAGFPWLAPPGHVGTREQLRTLSSSIAATLRRHAYQVLLADRRYDDDLARVLGFGLAAAVDGRWNDLAVVEQAPSTRRALRRYVPRVLIVLALGVIAFLGPVWFPSLIGSAAGEFRATLLAAAALALSGATGPAVEKATSVIGRRK